MGMGKIILIIGVLLVATHAYAGEYHCTPRTVVDTSGEWLNDRINKYRLYTVIKNLGWGSEKTGTIFRCSFFPSENRSTCDTYPIDYHEITPLPGALSLVDKFYHFNEQLDVQLFSDSDGNISYIENDGRGTIYRGECVTHDPGYVQNDK